MTHKTTLLTIVILTVFLWGRRYMAQWCYCYHHFYYHNLRECNLPRMIEWRNTTITDFTDVPLAQADWLGPFLHNWFYRSKWSNPLEAYKKLSFPIQKIQYLIQIFTHKKSQIYNPVLLVFIFKEISLPPKLSSPPCFRIQGGGGYSERYTRRTAEILLSNIGYN